MPRQVRAITYPEGELVVDENTGEVLEWPEGVTDKIDWLIGQVLGSRTVEKEWAALKGFQSDVLRRLLGEHETDRYQGEHGSASMVTGRDNRYGDPDKVMEVKETFELTVEQMWLILVTATKLDLKKIGELETDESIPEGVTDALTSGGFGKSWVNVRATRRQAPKMESRIVADDD